MAAEEQRNETAETTTAEETLYKTKVIQFLGRTTRIILQNDNGPCPLLAICNVLLLRNNLNLSLDVAEVSLQKLLSLVAERLIDSNSNVQDIDDGYVNNQQQNISDAIDLLPRLATGIDVNVHFRKISDFEFTRECAIFDLLDIGLYHGWIIDPQDTDTAAAIGSKSYNTIVSDLVQASETRKFEGHNRREEEEDCVDFVAATTATFGVPSPSLSRGRSFDDQVLVPVEQRKKGDIQEEEELMRALNLSITEVSPPVSVSMSPDVDQSSSSLSLDGNEALQRFALGIDSDSSSNQTGDGSNNTYQSDMFASKDCHASTDCQGDALAKDDFSLHATVSVNFTSLAVPDGSLICETSGKSEDNIRIATVTNQAPSFQFPDEGGSDRCGSRKELITSEADQSIMKTCQNHENPTGDLVTASLCNLQSSNGAELSNVLEGATSSLQGNEPIYEGEEHILKSPICTNAEPVYEGEMVLAEQAKKTEENVHPANIKDKVAYEQWHVIKKFLEYNASQLTIYGLFCLQEGLKERELCVFFRNNHFSTMFKFKGELYLLVTDQGYLNQPDLVWEKLNEVNGDTVFMTGNFMEFKADDQVHDSWNEQSAMTSTADFLAALESSDHPSSALSSDLQLAIALQQQEFEQQPQPQPQRPPQQHPQQPSTPDRSRLITGPPGKQWESFYACCAVLREAYKDLSTEERSSRMNVLDSQIHSQGVTSQ
ncbi:ubiquitin carboxyl-terminal hydrolase MINDY-2 [Canna indica]|uniref:Ubiquitin carboxyl-terminal hydrolase MINDY-2 n=1 Tax=Canna indica TaxID=4628 RepID=A0AAQ3QHT2_9LILI|nr:ubiquitin carboxyl-terminal hydrolase MINDY-2 [Canna indica]